LHRALIFISSGILFICVSAVLVIIGSGERDDMMIMLFGMAIPFLFVGFWNIYSVIYEKKLVSAESPRPDITSGQGDSAGTSSNEYFTWNSGTGAFGAGAFYNKKIIVPVFIIMFGTVTFAIVNAFLASSKPTEDIAIAVVPVSFVYGLVFTLYFLVKINKEVNTVKSGEEPSSSGTTTEDTGFKVAFFFASVATFGLFALGWWLYKKLKPSTDTTTDAGS